MKGNAVIHYIKYLLGIDKPETQTTLNERSAISKYAKNKLHCVEIGVFEGVNTITIAGSMDAGGTLYGIDPFFKGRLGICYHENIARHSLRKKKLAKGVQLISKLSFNATGDVPDGIDFIFIDGDHSFDGIKRDWEDWTKKMAPGAVILLHDTSIPAHDPSVKDLGSYKFFEEVIKHQNDFKHIETVDSLNVLMKK